MSVYIGRPYLRKIKGRKEERSMRKRGKREEDKKKMKIRRKKRCTKGYLLYNST